MFGSFGWMELLLILILIIVLIIFGAGKLPQLGEGLGKTIKGFKKSVHEADEMDAEAAAPQVQRVLQENPIEQSSPQAEPQVSRMAPRTGTVPGHDV
jgi:sec-independent protein translocase protein TatA